MAQDTVLQAFDRRLPILSRPTGNSYKSVNASGTATSNAIPPLFLVCKESKSLTDKANQVLNSGRIQNNHRKDNTAPTDLRPAFLLSSEADVVEASAIFVLAEIYEILFTLWPNRWCRRAEATNSSLSSGGSPVENVRYDLIFHAIDGTGQPGDTIAIIEYKKVGKIKHADFARGLLLKDPTPSQLKRAVKAAETAPSLLKQNAETYSKQASRYSKAQKCPRVALFDYDNLLLYHFHRKDIDFTAGAWADVVWVRESTTGVASVNVCPIRKALLGWLALAFEEKLGPPT